MSDAEFWSLTPRQYHLLLDVYLQDRRHTEWCFGVLNATVANFSPVRNPDRWLQPYDFSLPLLRRPAPPRMTPQRRDAVAASVRALLFRE